MTIIDLFRNYMWHTGKTILTVYDRDTHKSRSYEFEADRFDYITMGDDVWLSDDWVIDGVYGGTLEIAVWV